MRVCVRGEIQGRLIWCWRAPDFLRAETITATSADGITPSLLIARIINEIALGEITELNFNGKR